MAYTNLADHQNIPFICWLIKDKYRLFYFLDNFLQNRPYWVLKRQTVEVNVVGSFFFSKTAVGQLFTKHPPYDKLFPKRSEKPLLFIFG